MTRTLFFVFVLAFAQLAVAQDVTELAVGQRVEGRLAQESEDRYSLQLDSEQFIAGWADQITVDVVITVYGPEGERVTRIDVSGRGPEPFQFEVEDAGVYGIAIEPFEDEEGDYALVIERVEPIATEPAAIVDQLMAAVDREDSPGVVVGVVRDGDLVFSKAYGMANLTYDIPFTVDTPTNIGSTSKQFTAFAITMLADEGQIDLDADVRTYIPELPDLGETVTVRHLLTHTSGYREFLNALAMGGRRLDLGDGIEREEIIELVQRQPELQNAPGSEWNYNNTAFALLAEIVARVSGESFPDWMETNVFEPLGMTHTTVRANNHQIIPGASQGYESAEGGGWQNATDLGGAMGAGGIYTTVGDLVKWMQNYHTAELGGREVIDQMTTSYVLTNGDTTGYGFGLFVDEFRGQRRWQHGGADTAHRSEFGYMPDLNAGLIILSNFPGVPGNAGARIAEAFFSDVLETDSPETEDEPPAAEAAPETPPEDVFYAADFDAFVGRYEMEEVPGFVLTFRRDGDQFFAQATGQPEVELFHREGTTFEIRVVDAAVTFHRDDDGQVHSITLHQNGDHPANRLEEEAELSLDDFVGRYFSEELEAFYTVAVEEDELVLQHRRWDDVTLSHVSGDKFSGGFPIANIDFERDEGGAVTGLRAGSGRTRDVLFEKMN
ncbi:MAG: serine hydrolase [Rubricoccaceae bacterium]|nr:serine hydrolase [Rubricoccaceae bacterium]